MNRYASHLLIAVLALSHLAVAFAGEAQPGGKVARVGFLSNLSAPLVEPSLAAFRQGLHELGYVEGQNIIIVARYAEGQFDRFPALVKELADAKLDVIVTAGPQAIRAVKQMRTPCQSSRR
jgi:putative ABC transport system substrate-binding protein